MFGGGGVTESLMLEKGMVHTGVQSLCVNDRAGLQCKGHTHNNSVV